MTSVNTFGEWEVIAGNPSLDAVMDRIVTGRSVAGAEASEWIAGLLADVPPGRAVLDLGCGVGRNLIWMAIERPDLKVVGYDSEAMLSRVCEYAAEKHGVALPENVVLSSDWEAVCREKYDLAIVSLVFQHVKPEAIREYAGGLIESARVIAVHGRRWNDHSSDTTWEILEECGLHPSNADSVGYAARGHNEDHHLCIYRVR